MTLNQAIEVIELDLRVNAYEKGCDLEKAFNLGIEALKKEQRRRLITGNIGRVLLPGETEE